MSVTNRFQTLHQQLLTNDSMLFEKLNVEKVLVQR